MMIKGEDIPYMGEWADLKKNYLLEEKPEDYDELEEGKMLIEYLVAIQDKYSRRERRNESRKSTEVGRSCQQYSFSSQRNFDH